MKYHQPSGTSGNTIGSSGGCHILIMGIGESTFYLIFLEYII